MRRIPILISLVLLSCPSLLDAQVPQIINYQGRVTVGGTNFDGTGQFQFALVNGAGLFTYWSNGNSTVSLPVSAGLYSVLLGDTNQANMAAIPLTVFTNSDVWLRVWFGGGAGLQQMTPDRRLAASGYALMAGNVPDNAITSSKLSSGAVTSVAIAPGAVGTSQLANNAITAGNIATGAITSVNIASNTITAANMAPGAGVVPSGAFVLSQTATNPALMAAGFSPLFIITTNITVGGTNWTEATSAAPWSGRRYHASVVFNGRMWVLGGYNGGYLDDVWSSSDGTNWAQAISGAPWNARYGHAAVVFNGLMWVLGGWDGSSFHNDVWSSPDGTNWMQATSAAPWSAREYHDLVVFNGLMWVMGGYDGNKRNDVWSSPDGTNWTQVTSSAPWTSRNWHAAVVLNGRMWVMGGDDGSCRNDVWSSADGLNWTQATSAAPWSGRCGHAAVTLNGLMWVWEGFSITLMAVTSMTCGHRPTVRTGRR